MSSYDNKISIVIPSKNEAHKIYRCLDGIKAQSIKPKEIIVIDSGSTDGTQELVKTYEGVRLIEIPPSEFNHGGTRNLGVQHATGEYVLFTVQDAWARDTEWIRRLTDVLDKHDVVAVCGMQAVPHEKGANPVEWERSYSEPQVSVFRYDAGVFDQLDPAEKKRVSSVDNVNTIYRRDLLLKYPFHPVMEGEDTLWAKEMYLRGYAIAFHPGAKVYHYHTEKPYYYYKRSLLNSYLRYSIFGDVRPVPVLGPKRLLIMIRLLIKAKGISFVDKIKWLKFNIEVHKSTKQGVLDFNRLLAENEEALEERCKELLVLGLQRV